MTILLVDDEPDILESLSEVFEKHGFKVLCAPDGRIGLGLLERQKVSVILSDIKMPVMDGLSFMKLAKEKYPEIPFFLMTGQAPYSVQKLMEFGADGFIEKPNLVIVPILKKFGIRES